MYISETKYFICNFGSQLRFWIRWRAIGSIFSWSKKENRHSVVSALGKVVIWALKGVMAALGGVNFAGAKCQQTTELWCSTKGNTFTFTDRLDISLYYLRPKAYCEFPRSIISTRSVILHLFQPLNFTVFFLFGWPGRFPTWNDSLTWKPEGTCKSRPIESYQYLLYPIIRSYGWDYQTPSRENQRGDGTSSSLRVVGR